MTVGGAVLNGDVIEPLYAAGKEIRESNEKKTRKSGKGGID